ncbi:MAG: hypothetical protein JWL59_4688, partial [Chthoniobacteraceae bacterium]|nr:hypothetical protein [Chthoniobacteraceae bacterium]
GFRKGASALGVLKDLGLHGGLFHFHWYLPDTRPLCPLKWSKLNPIGAKPTGQGAETSLGDSNPNATKDQSQDTRKDQK